MFDFISNGSDFRLGRVRSSAQSVTFSVLLSHGHKAFAAAAAAEVGDATPRLPASLLPPSFRLLPFLLLQLDPLLPLLSQIPSSTIDEPLFIKPKLHLSLLPTHPVPRLAYLISGSASDSHSLKQTLQTLYHSTNHYVLHLDLKASRRSAWSSLPPSRMTPSMLVSGMYGSSHGPTWSPIGASPWSPTCFTLRPSYSRRAAIMIGSSTSAPPKVIGIVGVVTATDPTGTTAAIILVILIEMGAQRGGGRKGVGGSNRGVGAKGAPPCSMAFILRK